MNKKLTSLSAIRSLTTLIVFLATGYAYLVPLANVLRYHEQHHLFRFTADYFRQTLAEEGCCAMPPTSLCSFSSIRGWAQW